MVARLKTQQPAWSVGAKEVREALKAIQATEAAGEAPSDASAAASELTTDAAAAEAAEIIEAALVAAIQGDSNTVIAFLDSGRAVDVRGGRGRSTLLMKASAGGHLQLIDELLRRGADVNAQDDAGVTPLHAAAYMGYLAAVQRLLRAGTRTDVRNADGDTAGAWARMRRNHGIADLLEGLAFEPQIVRGLLSAEEIAHLLEQRSAERAARITVHDDGEGHQVIFLHAVRAAGELSAESARVLDGLVKKMRANDPRKAHDEVLNVRCAELHHYEVGAGLLDRDHRDSGSVLTMSVMLSDPAQLEGGEFVTYSEGVPVAHEVGRGDGILFWSEDFHNVTTVARGIRETVVIELWRGSANTADRTC